MLRRIVGGSLSIALFAASGAAGQVPTYDYSGRGAGSTALGDAGLFLLLEGAITNPRNADNVVAVRSGSTLVPIIPSWDDDPAGRIGFGYRWASGNRLWGQAWGFSTETAAASAAGPFLETIGPPVSAQVASGYDLETQIDATTADVIFARHTALSDGFDVEWSVGLRYASFEETTDGVYREGSAVLGASKRNEGEMIGVRGGLSGSWSWNHLVLEAGGALSLLDGELDASSRMTAPSVSPGVLSVFDDGRSGTIQELDLLLAWRGTSGKWLIGGGWESQVWEGITSDLVRRYPQAAYPLEERDSITFSGYRAVLRYFF
jgi:hypothetical protein